MENKNKTSWNKGLKLSDSHRMALSIAAKKRVARGLLPPSRKGMSFTPEQIEKRKSTILRGENHPNWKGGVSTNVEYQKKMRKLYAIKHKDKINHHKHLRRMRERNVEGSHTTKEWWKIKNIFDFTCPSCFKQEPEIILTKDHIVPLIRGGTDNDDNLQPLCRSCNSRKSSLICDHRYFFAVYKSLKHIYSCQLN